jgi:hypothetical protein
MAHRTVNSYCPVHTGQSGALSGAPLKFISETGALGFSARGNPSPGPAWPHLVEGASDSPVHTRQSGAPRPETLFPVSVVFQIGFVLTCEGVLE